MHCSAFYQGMVHRPIKKSLAAVCVHELPIHVPVRGVSLFNKSQQVPIPIGFIINKIVDTAAFTAFAGQMRLLRRFDASGQGNASGEAGLRNVLLGQGLLQALVIQVSLVGWSALCAGATVSAQAHRKKMRELQTFRQKLQLMSKKIANFTNPCSYRPYVYCTCGLYRERDNMGHG